MSRKLSTPWEVKDGSIFTATAFRTVGINGNKIDDQPDAIAFNVGVETARHICELHNKSLLDGHPQTHS